MIKKQTASVQLRLYHPIILLFNNLFLKNFLLIMKNDLQLIFYLLIFTVCPTQKKKSSIIINDFKKVWGTFWMQDETLCCLFSFDSSRNFKDVAAARRLVSTSTFINSKRKKLFRNDQQKKLKRGKRTK